MKKESFFITMVLIIMSILFTFLGLVMLVAFLSSQSEYPKQDGVIALSAIIAWMVIWVGAFITGVFLILRTKNSDSILRKIANLSNKENIDNEAQNDHK